MKLGLEAARLMEQGDLYPQKVPRAQRGGLNGHEGTRK